MPSSSSHGLSVLGALIAGILLLTLAGCSAIISAQERIGPDPDRKITVGTPRAEVEQLLGKPISTDVLINGSTITTYEYTARVGRDVPVFLLSVITLGLFEPILTPVAYFGKPKVTYQKDVVYGRDDTVADSPVERPIPQSRQ